MGHPKGRVEAFLAGYGFTPPFIKGVRERMEKVLAEVGGEEIPAERLCEVLGNEFYVEFFVLECIQNPDLQRVGTEPSPEDQGTCPLMLRLLD